jgi:hypothetical protein
VKRAVFSLAGAAALLMATSAHAVEGGLVLGGNWEGSFRHCWATKSFSQGEVRIWSGDTIELEVVWNDNAVLNATNISVRIDSTKLTANAVEGYPLGFEPSYELGTRNAILPRLFRAKRLQISFPRRPERSVNLEIGAARKAVAFLNMCHKFWTCVRNRDDRGKPKHCYSPRALDQYEAAPAEVPR